MSVSYDSIPFSLKDHTLSYPSQKYETFVVMAGMVSHLKTDTSN